MKDIITIICNKEKYSSFTVYYKDKFAEDLGWDEMLGLIASLTISEGKPCQQWLKTAEEYAKYKQSV